MSNIPEITPQDFAELQKTTTNFFLLDVRNPDEYADYNLQGYLIPLNELPNRIHEIPRNSSIIVHCRSGGRSAIATEFLLNSGFIEVKNLVGGVESWKKFSA